MPKQITITVYKASELPTEKAKQRARDWWREGDDDWTESVYEDAKQAGVKIVGYDIDRGSYSRIEFIDGAFNTANTIKAEHGPECDTYKAAIKYITAMDALPDTGNDDAEEESRNAESGDAIEAEFKKELEAAYLKSLRDEYEYRGTDEFIDEALEANEYEFTEDGKRFVVKQ